MNTNTLKRTGNTLLAGIVLAMTGGSLALPVAAEPTGALAQKTVSYADLDLSRSEGAATLYGRLLGAAKQVCGNPSRSLEQIGQWKACYSSALDEAVVKVDEPALTIVHLRQQEKGPSLEAGEPAVVQTR